MSQSRDKCPQRNGSSQDTFVESYLTTRLTDHFFRFFRTDVRGNRHSDPKTYVTLGDPKMYPHTKLGTPNSSIILELRPRVKVTVTNIQYATLCNPKTYPHNKYGFSTSNCTIDMLRA